MNRLGATGERLLPAEPCYLNSGLIVRVATITLSNWHISYCPVCYHRETYAMTRRDQANTKRRRLRVNQNTEKVE